MKLEQLHYFVVTAETQHIGKGSKILNVSPSAISHSIKNLEEILGGKLFEKSGKNIYLTEFGKRFALRAKTIIEQTEQLKVDFRSTELPIEGTLRVGSTHGLSNYMITPGLSKIQKAHPNLLFEAYSLRSAQVVEQVASGNLDVGICLSPNPHPSVTVHHSIKTSLKIAVRPDHPILKIQKKNLVRELSELPMASPKAFSGIEICVDHPALKKMGIRQQLKFIFDSYEVAASYLKNTSAWCLMPEPLLENLKLKSVEVPDFEAEASIALITPKGRALSSVVIDSIAQCL